MSENLQDRLKRARKAAGFTQAKIADMVGMSQPSYQQLESGKSTGSVFLTQIAHVLGVDALWLQTGNEPAELAPDLRGGSYRTRELQQLIEELDWLQSQNKLPPQLITMLQSNVHTVTSIQEKLESGDLKRLA